MNKRTGAVIAVIAIVLVGILALSWSAKRDTYKQTDGTDVKNTDTEKPAIPLVTVVAEDLEIPWDIAFVPGGDMLVTERPGTLLRIKPDGTRTEIPIDGVKHTSEGGLLGVTLHPDFSTNHFIYIYVGTPGASGKTENHVVRYELDGTTLKNKVTIIKGIPGAVYHDGGRLEFGPDGLLYITTGDATQGAIAQDKNSLGGKILRLKDDGTIPANNPFGTAIYSYGHRNPQGLAWDASGKLWETEHGPTGEKGLCCRDELNVIKAGGNYGWPTIAGDSAREGMTTSVRNSGAATWAPASLAYLNGSLYFGGLKGTALYEAVLDGDTVKELKTHFFKEYGRIRTVRVGPDNMLYLTTSNRDERGSAGAGDDKIIRVNPALLP